MDFLMKRMSRTKGNPPVQHVKAPPLFWSCRLILAVILCLGFVNLYTLRFNITVALPYMISDKKPLNTDAKNEKLSSTYMDPDHESERCTLKGNNEHNVSFQRDVNIGNLQWPKNAENILTGAFFFGYLLTSVPGGWLSQIYGGKIFFGWSIFGSGVFTLMIPIVAISDFKSVVFMRFFLGLFQGVSLPAMFVIWSRWVPKKGGIKLISFSFAGSVLGIVVSYPAATLLCESKILGGWPLVFYVTGLLGILWSFAWLFLAYDSPLLHPRISEAEKEYFIYNLRHTISLSLDENYTIPWKYILSSRTLIATAVTLMFSSFVFFTVIAFTKKYLYDVMNYNLHQSAVISSLPFIGFFIICVSSGALYDYVVAKRKLSRTEARKIANTIGTVIPAILLLCLSFVDCENDLLAVSFLIIGFSFGGCQTGAGFFSSFIELAPQHVGVIYGLSNLLGTIFGLTSSFVVNNVTKDRLYTQWQVIYHILAVVCVIECAVFDAFGSGEMLEWSCDPDMHPQ